MHRFLYLNVIEMNSGWGAESFIHDSLIRNGNFVRSVDYRKHRKTLAYTIKDSVIDNSIDSLIVQRGEYLPAKLISRFPIKKAMWCSELVSRRKDFHHLLRKVEFDIVYVRTPSCKKYISDKGWIDEEKISIMLSGFDNNVHFDRKLKKDIDILFIGNISKRRRKILDEIEKKFTIKVCSAYGDEMSKLFNRSKIVLNIHSEEYLDTETRVFEVLGNNTLLITETLSEENPFENGKHLVECSSVDDIVEKIGYYLEHDDDRVKISNSGYSEAVRSHTWNERALQIESDFDLVSGDKVLNEFSFLEIFSGFYGYIYYIYAKTRVYLDLQINRFFK